MRSGSIWHSTNVAAAYAGVAPLQIEVMKLPFSVLKLENKMQPGDICIC
jgi:hypothetical protein